MLRAAIQRYRHAHRSRDYDLTVCQHRKHLYDRMCRMGYLKRLLTSVRVPPMLVPLGSSFSICAPISAASWAAPTAGTSSRSLALLIADACLFSDDTIGLPLGCSPVGTLLLLLLLPVAGSDLSAECTADMEGRWLPMRAKREPAAAAATELRFLYDLLLSSPPPAAFALPMPPADSAARAMLPGERGSPPPALLNMAPFLLHTSIYVLSLSLLFNPALKRLCECSS
jgi:hypothetical protein